MKESQVDLKDFARSLYRETVLHTISNLEDLDKDKYIIDLSPHTDCEEHKSCFWYCVDVCWNNKIRDVVDMAVCLFQCLFYNLSSKINEEELKVLENKVRLNILDHLYKNIENSNEKIVEYNKKYNVDLFDADISNWWKTFG